MSPSESDDIADRKAALRKQLLQRRMQVNQNARPDSMERATLRLLDAIPISGHNIISGYHAIRSELEADLLMEALCAQGVRVCSPVIDGPGRALSFREWLPGCKMIEGAFGAMIPAQGDQLEPDIVIAPLLAWDRQGHRLGYGGGFYDRTLQRLRARGPVLAYGFAYAAQEIDEVPADAFDQKLDGVITENEAMIL